MAASRTNLLTDEVLAAELATLYNSLVIPIDDPSYSAIDTKKIKISTLLSLVNTLISDLELRVTDNEDDIIVNISDIQNLQNKVDVLDNEIPWATGTNVWGALQGGSNIRACKVGKMIYVSGIVNTDYAPSPGTTLFTLPSEFPVFTESVYISATGGAKVSAIRALSGTRNIVAYNHTSDTDQVFSAAIPVI